MYMDVRCCRISMSGIQAIVDGRVDNILLLYFVLEQLARNNRLEAQELLRKHYDHFHFSSRRKSYRKYTPPDAGGLWVAAILNPRVKTTRREKRKTHNLSLALGAAAENTRHYIQNDKKSRKRSSLSHRNQFTYQNLARAYFNGRWRIRVIISLKLYSFASPVACADSGRVAPARAVCRLTRRARNHWVASRSIQRHGEHEHPNTVSRRSTRLLRSLTQKPPQHTSAEKPCLTLPPIEAVKCESMFALHALHQ